MYRTFLMDIFIMRQVQRAVQVWMSSSALVVAAALAVMVFAPAASAQTSDASLVAATLKKLNDLDTVRGAESAKSYRVLFDAYLELKPPPSGLEIGPAFNLNTIHPKMPEWSKVTGWAESNPKMAQAVIACDDPKYTKIGLPYGREGLDPKYIKAGLTADVGVQGSLRDHAFPYVKAVDTIAAFVTAESYRLLEANQSQQALDLMMAMSFVVRQFCDREFLSEKLHFVDLLSDLMENTRDMMYAYQDRISADQFRKVAQLRIPYLRPGRDRLFMPEADRIVSEALIREVFRPGEEQVDVEKFASTFAEVQSKNAPLTRFGAAKRWQTIATVHSPLQDSLARLTLVYDDWWRRWRIDQYDERLLSVPTQFERTNAIRYAAVIYSLQNLSNVFAVRNTLVAEVNGTAVAAGLCGYKKNYQTYPDDKEKAYTQFMRKVSDSDPFDKQLKPFKFNLLSARQSVDDDTRRIWLEPGECVLWSQGQDHEDNRAATHSFDAARGDLVLWPPIKAVERAQGLLE